MAGRRKEYARKLASGEVDGIQRRGWAGSLDAEQYAHARVAGLQRMLSTGTIAQAFGVTPRCVLGWAYAGVLPGVRVGRGRAHWRFDPVDVAAFIPVALTRNRPKGRRSSRLRATR